MDQQITQPLCIVSGPLDTLDEAARQIGAVGGQVLIPEGHGLPSHPDPITAAAAGAPNSGHTPGTLHPETLEFIVGKGDHGKDHPGCPGKGCDHIGQTEPRPNPLKKHHGKPYKDDPTVGFLAVESDDPTAVAEAAGRTGWMLRMHVSPVLQTIEEQPGLSVEDRIAIAEQQLTAIRQERAR